MNNMTLGELIEKIGELVIQYEKSEREINIEDKTTKIFKTKDVLKMYPALTMYALTRAVKEDLIPVIKIGNINYFSKEDIEKFIRQQTLKNKLKNL